MTKHRKKFSISPPTLYGICLGGFLVGFIIFLQGLYTVDDPSYDLESRVNQRLDRLVEAVYSNVSELERRRLDSNRANEYAETRMIQAQTAARWLYMQQDNEETKRIARQCWPWLEEEK